MESHVIVAIDGPAGSGKSTTSRLLAHKLGISYLDTGAMYRAVALHFVQNELLTSDENLSSIIDSIRIDIKNNSVYLNDVDVSSKIRTQGVSSLVSEVSCLPLVRSKLVEIQRSISRNQSIVIDGRDIGTVVFPNADFKFFVTASIEVRAVRRYEEMKLSDDNIDINQIMMDIRERDRIDSSRSHSPLVKANDAILIDTTDLDIDQQVNRILEIINKQN